MSAPEEPQGSVYETADADGTVSDEELDRMRQENLDLQRQISEAEAERVTREQALANSQTAARLRSENQRLQLLLAQAKGIQPVVDAEPQTPVETPAPEVAAPEAGTGPVAETPATPATGEATSVAEPAAETPAPTAEPAGPPAPPAPEPSPTATTGEPVAPTENPLVPGAAPESTAPATGEGE